MAAALLGRALATAVGSRCFLSPTCSVEKWFSKYFSSDNRPKQPMSAYIRFYKDQQPIYKKQNPDVSILDITKKIAQVWRELPASDKKPYEAAAQTDRQIYKEQMARYKAELTPAEEAALKEEKRRKFKKRKATRKKRQLTVLGKPKRPRSAFNIFMSEHFQEAKGVSIQAKMKNVFDDWQKLHTSQKKTYLQLAEDDKIRYENEMKSWEEHMVEIGREDLIRYKNRRTVPKRKKTAKQASKKRATAVKKPLGTKSVSLTTNAKKVKAKRSEE
nr:PREDICTED: transcription factor A, mitochondrial isoform X2 [Anolis carolinensis]|eukprot:XP_008117446.1 PREDICTED: transcription factor A, mitochondrial isoform X2 [Anolis carolinensis]